MVVVVRVFGGGAGVCVCICKGACTVYAAEANENLFQLIGLTQGLSLTQSQARSQQAHPLVYFLPLALS